MALLWNLNLSDGEHSLHDIEERSRLNMSILMDAAEALCRVNLLKKI